MPPTATTTTAIKFFGTTCEFGCFSNMFSAKMTIDGKTFPTNEHFFQAKKFEHSDPKYFETVRNAANPKSAKALGKSRKHPICKNWNENRIKVMEEGLRAKFTQHEDLKNKLIGTGERELIENAPRDYFWGGGAKGTGQNKLGHLLMDLRKELCLKSSSSSSPKASPSKKAKKESSSPSPAGKKK